MKAIVLAGGEGRRLRPITEAAPKPMVPLVDRPVLAHTVELLRRHGFTEICMTLGYLPDAVRTYFGDGRAFGVRIETRTEETPLGTAGGVRACADFVGDEDVLVISGDAVCSFDLSACMAAHREAGAEATIVLYPQKQPTEYGLVTTSPDGQVRTFLEKPAWEQVVTDCVNTGIYILSPSALREIPPDRPVDFARDLFPALLAQERRLAGWRAEGYWCDVGSPAAYLRCCMDALAERIGFGLPGVQTSPGVWCAGTLPDGVSVTPPVFIDRDTEIGRGAQLGPYAIVNRGSRIGVGAAVRESVIRGAAVGDGARIAGAIVCEGVVAGRGSAIREGAVLGRGTVLGRDCLVAENVRIWPSRQIPDGTHVTKNVVTGMLREAVRFGADGRISGEFGAVITPETGLALGLAAGEAGRTVLGWGGGEAARVTAEAIACGVSAAGREAVETDASCAVSAAFAGAELDAALTVFVRQYGGEVSVLVRGRDGVPLSREEERTLETGFADGTVRAAAAGAGPLTRLTGVQALYTAALSRSFAPCGGLPAAAQGRGAAARLLRETLSSCGCAVQDRRPGLPAFSVTEDGTALTAEDENGKVLDWDQLRVMAAAAEFARGGGRVAAPPDAPAALELLADSLGRPLLRLGRDGEAAEQLYRQQRFLRDGIAAAVWICAAMAAGGETLAAMHGRMPRFATAARTVRLTRDRGAVMRALTAACTEFSADLTDGLTLRGARGTARVSPCREQNALEIRAESEDTELAEELCRHMERLTRRADREADK